VPDVRAVTGMSGKGTLKNFKVMLAEAKLPERTVEICLRGDLVAEHQEAERELERAEKNPANSLAGNGAAEVAERIQALEAEMQESVYTFRLRGLPAPQFRAFKAEHPSRLDDKGDAKREDVIYGFNIETGFEPLTRLCVIDPELDDETWAQLMGTLTENQFEELAAAAWYLNRGDVDIPFSSAASRLMSASGAESSSPSA
jgi:hypothetical protein